MEPVACALHAVLDAGVREGETVAVLGAGTLGLATTAAWSSPPAVWPSPATCWSAPVTRTSAGWPPSSAPPTRSRPTSSPGRCAAEPLAGPRHPPGRQAAHRWRRRGARLRGHRRVDRPGFGHGPPPRPGGPGRHAGRVHVDLAPLWHREVP